MRTPWGRADFEERIAPGITFYGTPSHGGVLLSEARYEELPPAFRGTEFGGNTRWFEEDCDLVKVIVAFPQFFLTTYRYVNEHQRIEVARDWHETLTRFERLFVRLVPALLAHWSAQSLTDLAAQFETRYARETAAALSRVEDRPGA